MSLELLAAEKLLEMALGGIAGNAASEGVIRLWQMIKNRLRKNQPVIEAEIVELEQNPSQENLKPLKAFLEVEMHKDRLFAEEISKLAQEIAKDNSGDNITVGEVKAKAKDTAITAAKIDVSGGRLVSKDTNINVGKN